MEGVYPESVTEIVADYRNTFFICSIAWRFTKASTVISNTDLCCYGFKLCPDSGRNGSDRLSDVERLSAAYVTIKRKKKLENENDRIL